MIAIRYLIWLVSSFAGTYLFCLSMRSPRKSVLPTSAIAALGYVLFMLFDRLTHSQTLAYFLATLLIATGSELLATLMRMPATIFMFPAVIPMVPGIGLYRTMLSLIQKNYDAFLDTGAQTLLALGAMAIALALTNEIARRIHGRPKHPRKADHPLPPQGTPSTHSEKGQSI